MTASSRSRAVAPAPIRCLNLSRRTGVEPVPIQPLDFAEPFFPVNLITDQTAHRIGSKSILLNFLDRPTRNSDQHLDVLQSAIVVDTELEEVNHAVIVEHFADHPDEVALFAQVRETWPSAFEQRGEERLRGDGHYMSPNLWDGQFGFTFYHAGSLPPKVGLHRDHPFCPVPGFREVHTQIVGFGKMQQCREQEVATLNLEEQMAPGTTHRPMYDAEGSYPWHQFETITASIFVAVEMLPDGAEPPNDNPLR